MHDSPTQAIEAMNMSFKKIKIRFCLQKNRKPLVRFHRMPGGIPMFSITVAASDCIESAQRAWDLAQQLAQKLEQGEIQEGDLARVRDELAKRL